MSLCALQYDLLDVLGLEASKHTEGTAGAIEKLGSHYAATISGRYGIRGR